MTAENDFYNRVGFERISSRQIDELVGIARGLLADGKLDQSEVEFLQKWLAANVEISDQPLIGTLYDRVNEILRDKVVDADEASELFETLNRFVNRDFELGETLKATSLPLNDPAPDLVFPGRRYCFTGTFTFGQRKQCERAVTDRGGAAGGLTQKTQFLVIGTYATESWKHSSFGNKILQACEWRDRGLPVAIVSEAHWIRYL
ncbi:MAG: BRCT domain-containing protein [Terriglobales bacterium]